MSTKNLLIISPHLDDAVLSCCDHAIAWQKKGGKIFVITVFTKFAAKQYSIDAQTYVEKSGFSIRKVRDFEAQRKREDKAAMKVLGFNSMYLGMTDGGFRVHANKPLYSSHSNSRFGLFSGRISIYDQPLLKKLTSSFSTRSHFDRIIVPLGIGNHVDHLLVKKAAELAFTKSELWYYLDFPYALNIINWRPSLILKVIKNKMPVIWISEQKKQALKCYSSQFPLLFSWIHTYPELILK